MTQLHLQLHGATSYLQNPWAFGANIGSASLLLRKEVQRQLLMGRDELGFRHVRFGGALDDAMVSLQPDGSYDFTPFEQAFDWLMESGLCPFIGLSGVPSDLRPADGAGPVDPERWAKLAGALASFADARYGCDAQEWHFEVWPGADDPDRWAGDREAYFRLYDLTARAIKSVNGQLKVGGPAAADAEWVAAFADHVSKPSEAFGIDGLTRCDFVSITGLPAAGGSSAGGRADLAAVVARVTAARAAVSATLGETVPVILADWSAAGPVAGAAHDRCSAAATLAGTIAPLADLLGGALYAGMSDITGPDALFEPFHGGTGLVTVNDVRKPTFNALKFLNDHVGYKLNWDWQDPIDGLSIVVTRDYHHVIRILAAYDAPAGTPPARFTLDGLPEHVKWGQVQVIRPSAGSAVERWEDLGSPRFVNRYVLEDLDAAAEPAATEVNFQDFPPRLEPGMTLQLTIPMPDDLPYAD